MNRIQLRSLLALWAAIFVFAVHAEAPQAFSPLWGSYSSENVEADYAVTVGMGTHIVGAGFSSGFAFSTPLQTDKISLGFVETQALLQFKHYLRYLGIPGASDMATIGMGLTYGMGPENGFPSNLFNHAGPARHNFTYRYTWYLSTDGTNQTTGRLAYELAGDRSKVKLQFDNDMFRWPIRDEWRTAAAEIEFLRVLGDSVGGLSLGFIIWTGTTEGLLPSPGSSSLDLSNVLGGQYSNGIAFVSLIWGMARLSIGYDSEAIRDALQNTAHRFGNWYEIPALDRPNRWYVQVSLGAMDSLFQ